METTEKKPISEYTKAELKQHLQELETLEKVEQEAKVKAYEDDKDAFLRSTLNTFLESAKALVALKEICLKEGLSLNERMYRVYDREPKEQKNISLISEDGQKKLEVAYQDKIVLDDSALVGIDMIHEVMEEKYANRNKAMYRAMQILLSRNGKGDYDPKMVIKLKAMSDDIKDERFDKGLKIISDAWRIGGTGTYVRMYQKESDNKWENISLQFSNM
jgi:hypothetical protein